MSLPHDGDAALARLQAGGVQYDEHRMLKPVLSDETVAKAAYSFGGCRARIDALRACSTQVLYMPGSYDLVHAGHAWHIEAAVERFGDAPVVALADDDELIAATKGPDRPVQTSERSPYALNWRLYELASIPRVRTSGFLPSPMATQEVAGTAVLESQCGPGRLEEILRDPPDHLAAMGYDEALNRVVHEYADLLTMMHRTPRGMVEAFKSGIHPWSIQAWQLYLHCYLGAGRYDAPMVRVMSHHDDAHAIQVAYLMHAAGIQTRYLHELELVSTSSLLEQHSKERLLEAKLRNYRSM